MRRLPDCWAFAFASAAPVPLPWAARAARGKRRSTHDWFNGYPGRSERSRQAHWQAGLERSRRTRRWTVLCGGFADQRNVLVHTREARPPDNGSRLDLKVLSRAGILRLRMRSALALCHTSPRMTRPIHRALGSGGRGFLRPRPGAPCRFLRMFVLADRLYHHIHQRLLGVHIALHAFTRQFSKR